MQNEHEISGPGLSATIAAAGAELVSLRNASGEEFLWQAGPEWPRHAPVLFPIVGRLADDVLRHGGAAHRLTQHGFARDARFEWAERSAERASLVLSDSAATRAAYPFPFRLEMTYATEGDGTLAVTARVDNTGRDVLPFSLGAHPAFRWPLVEGVPKTSHRVSFDQREPGPLRSVVGGLLGGERPLPFDGRTLPLDETLFAADALVLPDIASRSLRYGAYAETGEELAALTVSFEGYRDLGLWSKPSGADFLCIEPWYGMASPVGWDGSFEDKPGLAHLAAGESLSFTWRATVPQI